MERRVGTVSRGVRCPIIREGDDLAKIVVDSVVEAGEYEGFGFNDKDVVAITESVVARNQGNYASVSQIGKDVENKFGGKKHIGIVFPTPVSRNRFSLILKSKTSPITHTSCVLNTKYLIPPSFIILNTLSAAIYSLVEFKKPFNLTNNIPLVNSTFTSNIF